MSIKRLSNDTIKILQAQKYIFDYTQIIKELLENSLDAKSTRIIINLSKDLEIWDDGVGMESEIDYFSTNKDTESVLDGCNTNYYGYKGIFLSSLKDICDLKIITKRKEDKLARFTDYKSGVSQKVAREDGTSVIVSNLFKNSPVRKNVLKLKVPEIVELLESFTVFQCVFIRLTVGNKTVFEKQGTNIDQFVRENNPIQVSGKSFDFFYKLSGFKNSLIIANKRIITNKRLVKKIKNTLEVFFRPKMFYILLFKNVRIDILSIDKQDVLLENEVIDEVIKGLEVELSDSRPFVQSEKDLRENTSKKKLEKDIAKKPKVQKEESRAVIWGETVINVFSDQSGREEDKSDRTTSYIDSLLSDLSSNENKENLPEENLAIHQFFKKTIPNVEKEIQIAKKDLKNVQIIGQFNHGFILGMLSGFLMVFDQHAADEIYNYEMLKKNIKFNKQGLLQPINISEKNFFEISSDEPASASKLDQNMLDGLSKSFEIRGNKLMSSPSFSNQLFGKKEYLEFISSGELSALSSKMASKACRMSIMIGDKLNPEAMKRIVYNLSELENPWSCPHGRPTFQVLYKF